MKKGKVTGIDWSYNDYDSMYEIDFGLGRGWAKYADKSEMYQELIEYLYHRLSRGIKELAEILLLYEKAQKESRE